MPAELINVDQRRLFLQHVAQTSAAPLAIEIEKAEDCFLWDKQGRRYIDLIAGISVCNVGHRHPDVIRAIHAQLDRYLHAMVYGELVESPQVQYASWLARHLPPSLDSVYFTNSGTEATEGAMKLAKRVTGRPNVLAFHQSYHGSSQGALSIMGDEYWRNAFRPLLPGIRHASFNSPSSIDEIDNTTACVVMEFVQAEAGVLAAEASWLRALRERCTATGTLLVMDAIQTGFGRTGHWWGFEPYEIVPDVLLLGKALGGGMPLGAFVASRELMWQLTDQPILGHITTFGGHPVCCAAGLAAARVLEDGELIGQVERKAHLFRERLQHAAIRSVRSAGLLMAVELDDFAMNKRLIDGCLEEGVFTDWFLFASHCMRIAPPLTISDDLIIEACNKILGVLQKIV